MAEPGSYVAEPWEGPGGCAGGVLSLRRGLKQNRRIKSIKIALGHTHYPNY